MDCLLNLLGRHARLEQQAASGIVGPHQRLAADPPARVADIACGCGWTSIALARAYPKITVEGIDLDSASIEQAQQNLAGSGVDERVRFHHRDAADAVFAERFDVVTVFEVLHDMPRPAGVLRTIRGMVNNGFVFIGDERTEEWFTAPASGMVGSNPAGTGTPMRPGTLRRYATEAGFTRVEILPIENDSWRFYLLAG